MRTSYSASVRRPRRTSRSSSRRESGLLQDAVPCPGREILTAMPGDGHGARLPRMSILSMTADDAIEPPPVALDQTDRIAHFRHTPVSHAPLECRRLPPGRLPSGEVG